MCPVNTPSSTKPTVGQVSRPALGHSEPSPRSEASLPQPAPPQADQKHSGRDQAESEPRQSRDTHAARRHCGSAPRVRPRGRRQSEAAKYTAGSEAVSPALAESSSRADRRRWVLGIVGSQEPRWANEHTRLRAQDLPPSNSPPSTRKSAVVGRCFTPGGRWWTWEQPEGLRVCMDDSGWHGQAVCQVAEVTDDRRILRRRVRKDVGCLAGPLGQEGPFFLSKSKRSALTID